MSEIPKFKRRDNLGLGTALLTSNEAYEKRCAEIFREDLDVLIRIRDSFGIQPTPGWELRLTFKLAMEEREHDKYLEPKKKGRRTKWNMFNRALLVIDHLHVKESKGLKDEGADTHLLRHPPWSAFVEESANASNTEQGQSLRRQRKLADPVVVEKLLQRFQYFKKRSELDEWDAFVSDMLAIVYK